MTVCAITGSWQQILRLWQMALVKEYIYESGHPFMMSMPPVHMRSVGETGRDQGASPGEHTDEILKQLGCSEDEIVHLKEAGAVKQHS